MRLPDFMSVVVYLLQLLLLIPCALFMAPLPRWLHKELHWQMGAAIGAYVLVCCVLWLAAIMLIMSILYAFRRRR
jgi:hypothetical protein